MRKNFIIYIAVVIILAVCCIASCLGLAAIGGYSVFKSLSKTFEQANENITGICEEVNSNNFDGAYDLMSSDYQRYHNIFEFKSYAESKLTGCIEMDDQDTKTSESDEELEISATLKYSKQRTKEAVFTFDREDGEWKLDDIDF